MNHRLVLCLSAVLSAVGLAPILGQVGPAPQQNAVPVDSLIQLLTAAGFGFNEYTSASSDLVARGAEAVPLLVKQLPTCGDPAKLRILGTLSRIGAASAPALPEVRRLLQAGSPSVRAASADYLRAMGPASREALPDLFKALDDSDEITVGTAAQAIDVLDPDFIGVRLKELLDRLGTSPVAVHQLTLGTWYGIACRGASDPALVRDLRHWMLIVRLTSRKELRVGDALGAERLLGGDATTTARSRPLPSAGVGPATSAMRTRA